jgi:hypothetical protein
VIRPSALLCFVALPVALALPACGDLKTASPGDGADGGGDSGEGKVTGGGSSPLSPSAGPGAHGSLPSGYCCTQDAECRDRHCTAVNGMKMCLDTCFSQSKCERRGREGLFQCDGSIAGEGLCQPKSPTLTCLAQDQFIRGTRAVGACCEATGDGNAGDECEGNQCVAVDEEGQSNPFVCSQWCESTKDCPSPTICSPFNTCVPGNRPYTCN